MVEGKALVEIKALIKLEDVHFAQIKNYLVAYNVDVGLLLNFGATSLAYKRIYHPRMSILKSSNPINPDSNNGC